MDTEDPKLNLLYKVLLRILDEITNMNKAGVPREYILMHTKKLHKAIKKLRKYQKSIHQKDSLSSTINWWTSSNKKGKNK